MELLPGASHSEVIAVHTERVNSTWLDGSEVRCDDARHHLVWHLEGTLIVRAADRTWMVPPRAGIWLPASVGYQLCGAESVSFGIAAFVRVLCPPDWNRLAPVTVNKVLANLLMHMIGELTPAERHHVEVVVFDMLHSLLGQTTIELQIPTEERCRTVAEGVLSDPASDWELADWAAELGTGTRNLTRLFQQETGMTFGQWRTRARIYSAIAALADDVPVAEVSRRVGYSSASTFVRAFRRATGRTPTSYFAESSEPGDHSLGRELLARPTTSPFGHTPQGQPLLSAAEYAALREGTEIMNKSPQPVVRAALLAMTMLIAACGGSSASGAGSTEAGVEASEAPVARTTEKPLTTSTTSKPAEPVSFGEVSLVGAAEGGRRIRHHDGETVVPLAPETIVSVDIADGLVALGVVPAGASDWESSYMADALEGVPNLGDQLELNYEQLAGLRPDLIIAHTSGDEGHEAYDLLSEIAPTVTILNPAVDFKLSQRQLGLVIDRIEEVETRIAEYDEAITDAKVQMDDLINSGTVALLNIREDHYRLYGVNIGYTGPFLYGQLGMTPSDLVLSHVPSDRPNEDISLEFLPDLQADHIVVLYAEGLDEQWMELQESSIWQALPAVESGNVYPVSSTYWYASGLLAHEYKIDELLQAIAAS